MKIIDGAERELSIMMACFGPDKDILSGIKRAMHRGVRARILIPKTANFNDDMNRLTVSELNRFSGSPDGGSGVRLGIYMTENDARKAAHEREAHNNRIVQYKQKGIHTAGRTGS